MGNCSRRLDMNRLKADGVSLVVAFLSVALLSSWTGIAYANVEDAADAAPAATFLGEAADDISGNDPSDDTPTVFVVPQVRTVLENGPLMGYEFSFSLKDADGKDLDEVTNDLEGNVEFSRIAFTADDLDTDSETGKPVATTFAYYVSVLPQDERLYDYDTSVIQMSVTVTPGEDGTLKADVVYARIVEGGRPEPTDDPTFTNRYVTVVISRVKRSREEPYDPLPGAHIGLWMVNPRGEDWYLGLGRNQPEAEGSELESNGNGEMWWDVPVISYGTYYFMEEWPPPAGHLVDPYPSDYFQLVFDEDNSYQTVYEAEESFLFPVGHIRRRGSTGESTGPGNGDSANSNPVSDGSISSEGSAVGTTASDNPVNATPKTQQTTTAATSRTSTQKLPATSDMASSSNLALLFAAGILALLAGSVRQRRACFSPAQGEK